MQSRFNSPGWYGLGSALARMLKRGRAGRELLREMHAKWPFFRTLIDNAQLAMLTADMGIARVYASMVTDSRVRHKLLTFLEAECGRTEAAILVITSQRNLLGRDTVLLKSIELHNPYIDPLNYLQLEMPRRLRGGL
jgi:phosphoenolpyruvate carboxylase